MPVNKLKSEHEIYDIFCNLVQIPSPSKSEDEVIKWINNFCKSNSIDCVNDDYGNIIINVPAKNCDKTIALSAHMDVVGDDSPVNISAENGQITACGRTLGADDKVGVSCALLLAKEFVNADYDHCALQIVFTRDEESGMSGIRNFDFSNLTAQYVLVCDADKLGQLLISGASYTLLEVKLDAFKGGHSGIDIADKTRPNSAKLIADFCSQIPQGVFCKDETGVITSINIGGICAGNTNVTNVINTDALATYSIRSASVEKENELKTLIKNLAENFNKKYVGIAKVGIFFEEHLPAFEKSSNRIIPKIFIEVCSELSITPEVASFHAGAETHIYAQNTNKNGEKFIPFLLGLANIYNMHSADEAVDTESLAKGYEMLKKLVLKLSN